MHALIWGLNCLLGMLRYMLGSVKGVKHLSHLLTHFILPSVHLSMPNNVIWGLKCLLGMLRYMLRSVKGVKHLSHLLTPFILPSMHLSIPINILGPI